MAKQKPFNVRIDQSLQWRKIVSEVDKSCPPVDFITKSTVYLNNGDEYYYDVTQMFNDGFKSNEIADTLNDEYDHYGDTLHHVINSYNIKAIKKLIEPLTDQLLSETK